PLAPAAVLRQQFEAGLDPVEERRVDERLVSPPRHEHLAGPPPDPAPLRGGPPPDVAPRGPPAEPPPWGPVVGAIPPVAPPREPGRWRSLPGVKASQQPRPPGGGLGPLRGFRPPASQFRLRAWSPNCLKSQRTPSTSAGSPGFSPPLPSSARPYGAWPPVRR